MHVPWLYKAFIRQLRSDIHPLHFCTLIALTNHREQGGWEHADSNAVLRSAFTAAWSAASQQPLSGVRARTAAKKLPTQVWEDLVLGSGYASEVSACL